MKIIAKILSIFRKDVGDEVFDDLIAIYPRGNFLNRGDTFECVLPSDDPIIKAVMNRLERASFRPWARSGKPDDKHEYSLILVREYKSTDFAECRLIQLLPYESAWNNGDSERYDPKGEAVLYVNEHFMPKRKYDLYRGLNHSYFVPARVKALLESSSLPGIRFRPVLFIPQDWREGDTQDSIRARHGTPYWELDSDRSMPPLSPSLKLINGNGEQVPRGSLDQSFPVEGLYDSAELHYVQSDLERMEPFDVARTFERYRAWGAPGDRPMVVSKRFYDFWTKHGLKADWVPVRIDPE